MTNSCCMHEKWHIVGLDMMYYILVILPITFTIDTHTLCSCTFFVNIFSFVQIDYWKWNLMSFPQSQIIPILLLWEYFHKFISAISCRDVNKHFHQWNWWKAKDCNCNNQNLIFLDSLTICPYWSLLLASPLDSI